MAKNIVYTIKSGKFRGVRGILLDGRLKKYNTLMVVSKHKQAGLGMVRNVLKSNLVLSREQPYASIKGRVPKVKTIGSGDYSVQKLGSGWQGGRGNVLKYRTLKEALNNAMIWPYHMTVIKKKRTVIFKGRPMSLKTHKKNPKLARL